MLLHLVLHYLDGNLFVNKAHYGLSNILPDENIKECLNKSLNLCVFVLLFFS